MTDHATLTERRRKLRDFLVEKGPDVVNMSWWGRVGVYFLPLDAMLGDDLSCDTVGCLAGWGAHVAREDLQGTRGDVLLHEVEDYYGFEKSAFHTISWGDTDSAALRRGSDDLYDLSLQPRDPVRDPVDLHSLKAAHLIEHAAIVGYLDELIGGEHEEELESR